MTRVLLVDIFTYHTLKFTQYMEVGVHGNMEAAPNHVVVGIRLEEEPVPTQGHCMEGVTVQEAPLLLGAVNLGSVQVCFIVEFK